MTTTIERLVRMANQIAANFGVQSVDSAALAVADHITMFWDPRMKSMIDSYVIGGGKGLSPVAHEAVTSLRTTGPPAHQTSATEFATGQSDAG